MKTEEAKKIEKLEKFVDRMTKDIRRLIKDNDRLRRRQQNQESRISELSRKLDQRR